MISCQAKTRRWGNSIGVIIPKHVIEKEGIKPDQKVTLMVSKPNKILSETFGTLKRGRKTTEQMMREIDEGYC